MIIFLYYKKSKILNPDLLDKLLVFSMCISEKIKIHKDLDTKTMRTLKDL